MLSAWLVEATNFTFHWFLSRNVMSPQKARNTDIPVAGAEFFYK